MAAAVTVVIPTLASRRELLQRALDSVYAQSYRDFDIMVVPDGPTPVGWHYTYPDDIIPKTLPLGRRWGGLGERNRLVAGLLTQTDYIAYLDDDNWWTPDHLSSLMAAIDDKDFAYTQVDWCGIRIVGDGEPRTNHIDASAILHRTELLSVACWNPEDGYSSDGAIVERWIARGATFAFVPKVTVLYPRQSMGAA